MRYGLCLIVLALMLVSVAPAFADFWTIDEFCGGGPLCVGLKERLRTELTENTADVAEASTSDRAFYFRTRSQLYAEWKISDFDAARVQLTNEFRNYMFPTTKTRGSGHEIVFDHLYVRSKEVMESPVSLDVGRMDLLNQYSENFLFADGTPSDGSRTFFFDLARASISLDDQNTLDLLYISNDKKDKKLPRISKESSQTLNGANESGPALIWKSKLSDELYLEPYYVFKNEEYSTTLESDLNTIGAYVRYKMEEMTLRAQLAYQTGDYGNYDREGLGAYVFVDKPMKDWTMSPTFTAGILYLSGDDPNTNDVEGWNPLYSRFPYLDEAYAYILAAETGVLGYWTNTMMYALKCNLKVNDAFKAELILNYIMAPENKTASATFGTGDTKGLSLGTVLSYAFSKTVTGRWQFHVMDPGNFYASGADNIFFSRCEVALSF